MLYSIVLDLISLLSVNEDVFINLFKDVWTFAISHISFVFHFWNPDLCLYSCLWWLTLLILSTCSGLIFNPKNFDSFLLPSYPPYSLLESIHHLLLIAGEYSPLPGEYPAPPYSLLESIQHILTPFWRVFSIFLLFAGEYIAFLYSLLVSIQILLTPCWRVLNTSLFLVGEYSAPPYSLLENIQPNKEFE